MVRHRESGCDQKSARIVPDRSRGGSHRQLLDLANLSSGSIIAHVLHCHIAEAPGSPPTAPWAPLLATHHPTKEETPTALTHSPRRRGSGEPSASKGLDRAMHLQKGCLDAPNCAHTVLVNYQWHAAQLTIKDSQIEYRIGQYGESAFDYATISHLTFSELVNPISALVGIPLGELELNYNGIIIEDTSAGELYIWDIIDGYVVGAAEAPSCGTVIPEDDFETVAEPLLWKHGIELVSYSASGGEPGWWSYRFKVRESMTIKDFARVTFLVDQTARFPPHAKASPTSVLALLDAGMLESLDGIRESEWLDFKGPAYDFSRDRERTRLELGLAVARFANDIGGLIIIGVKTRKSAGYEEFGKLAPVPKDDKRVESYMKTIGEVVYPQIDGLEVRRFACGDGELVAIVVPPQVDFNKPYLVSGGLIDGKYSGSMISIVKRHGDGTIPSSPASIHATLAAGRALLSRGIVPKE